MWTDQWNSRTDKGPEQSKFVVANLSLDSRMMILTQLDAVSLV
ncbi:uncharacterized protein J3R85_019536 [Psidium guajava]|nr:uncharacterized protein J3R85_019536 [Psidium guajava]